MQHKIESRNALPTSHVCKTPMFLKFYFSILVIALLGLSFPMASYASNEGMGPRTIFSLISEQSPNGIRFTSNSFSPELRKSLVLYDGRSILDHIAVPSSFGDSDLQIYFFHKWEQADLLDDELRLLKDDLVSISPDVISSVKVLAYKKNDGTEKLVATISYNLGATGPKSMDCFAQDILRLLTADFTKVFNTEIELCN